MTTFTQLTLTSSHPPEPFTGRNDTGAASTNRRGRSRAVIASAAQRAREQSPRSVRCKTLK